MAYTSLYDYILSQNKPLEKRSDAALQTYSNADPRSWAANQTDRSHLIRDIVTRKPSSQGEGAVDLSHVSKDECLKKMSELQAELDKMHALYKEASKKNATLQTNVKNSEKTKSLLRTSQEQIKKQGSVIQKLKNDKSEEFDKVVKERDALRNKLKNMDEIKKRADEADRMEQEIFNLKRELERCKPSPSENKKPASACANCNKNLNELHKLKQISSCVEKKSNEVITERNFLRQKMRTIDLLEAELILYKSKYEECECKIRSLKEMVCKGEQGMRLFQQAQSDIKEMEEKIHECENQNGNLVAMIERLNTDLKERDIYIESLTKRLHEDCHIDVEPSVIGAKKAISYESIASGTVETLVKKLSIDSANNCKCKFSNCKCNELSTTKIPSKSTIYSKKNIDIAEFENMIKEVLYLRAENIELDKELKRVKEDLSQMTKMVNEVEHHRKSNKKLENELETIRSSFNMELEQMSSTYHQNMQVKLKELNHIEHRLADEIVKAQKLEVKFSQVCNELSSFKEFRVQCEKLHENYSAAAGKAEIFKHDCKAYLLENQELKRQIDELKCQIECLSETKRCEKQKEIIKKSVIDFKRHYDEKVQMIKCYEEKIKILEMENERLNKSMMSFSDDSMRAITPLKKAAKYGLVSLESDELVDVHDQVRNAMIDAKPSAIEIHTDYSKIFDKMCEKYNIPLHDEHETSSTRTLPRSRAKKKNCIKKARSKSNDVGKLKSR